MKIVKLEDEGLTVFMDWLGSLFAMEAKHNLSTLHVAIDVEGVKLKANDGPWSFGIGENEDRT